jgi:hypothetical protein
MRYSERSNRAMRYSERSKRVMRYSAIRKAEQVALSDEEKRKGKSMSEREIGEEIEGKAGRNEGSEA